jgi:hypothetical protein
MRLIYLCLLCLTLVISSPVLAAETPSAVELPTVTLVGTIKKIQVSGTCYQLVTPDGAKYELIGKFPHRDGLKVQVSGTLATNLMTICQVGRPLQVNSIKKISNFRKS